MKLKPSHIIGALLIATAFLWRRPLINAALELSRSGLDLIKKFEGFRASRYEDIAGKATIGYGHLIKPGETFPMTITQDRAEKILAMDSQEAQAGVRRGVAVPLTQNQFDALTSFVFNFGETNFRGSTLLKKLNAGDYLGAADEFLRWNKARVDGVLREVAGLTNRRIAERHLFLS